MAKNKVSEWSSIAANNTDISGINIAEGCAPSGINNAIREMMAQVRDMQSGTDADNFTVGGDLTVTGAASGTTPTAGDSSTKFATTAFVAVALAALYPVGSIYTNATNATNPGTLLGFGTWEAFAAGRVAVGFDASNPLFDAAEETGGSADAIVVSHTHTSTLAAAGTHTHTLPFSATNTLETGGGNDTKAGTTGATTGSAGEHTHTLTIDSTGSSGTDANYQPFITVYMWKRTA